jgi:hypothetical protein
MQWLDDLWGSVFGSGSSRNSTDISDYNRATDYGPGDVGIKQVGTGGTDSPGSSSISRDATGGSALGRDYTWRDWSQGLAQAAQAAGADNRFLPAGLAIGAFGSGLTRGMDTSQEDRIKLQMQQALQSAQAQNLLAQGGLAKAQASAVPSEIAQRQMATQYQSLVNQGYPTELAARIAETQSRTGLYTAQAGAIPSTILETVARTAYTQAMTAGQSQQQALAAAQAALANAEAQQRVLQNQRQIDSDRQVAGLPPINRAGSPVDDFSTRLGAAESSGNVAQPPNALGYAGLHQFGAPRLKDLGFYTPGEGENASGNTWTGNKWSGTFNIPGMPDVKTINDFLKGPNAKAAQDIVFANHVNDIDNKIRADGLTGYVGTTLPDGTPITMDGMRAAAHLGGYTGMKNYVTSGGKIDPDDGRTHLSTYMNRFAGAPSVAAPVQHTPAQLAIMGGGGAPGGGMGGITAPGFASPGATAAPAPPPPALPGGGFGARAGAPLNPQQSILNGGGDVLQGMPQPVPGSPGAPAQFAGPGATTAPLNPQQQLLNGGGFSGPGLEGGPAGNVLGGGVARPPVAPVPPVASVAPTTPAPVPAAALTANRVPVGPDGTNNLTKLSIPDIISIMPSWMRNSMAAMDVNKRNETITKFIESKVAQPFNISGAEAAAAGFGPFNDNAVIKVTPNIYGGQPATSVEQPGVSPRPVSEVTKELFEQFTAQQPIKDFETASTHLDQIKTLAKQYQANPTSQLSAALIIEIGKMIAPQAVRGTEQQMLSQASGIPGVQSVINRFTNQGGQFAVGDMPAMLSMVEGLHNGQAATAAKIADQFRLRAESNKGVNADDVVNPRFYPRDLAERAAKGSASPPPFVMPNANTPTTPAPAVLPVPTAPNAITPAPSAKATLDQVFANAKPAPVPDVPATPPQPQTGTQRRLQIWSDRFKAVEEATGLKPKPSADADPQVKAWQQAIAQQPSEVLNGLTVAEFQALPKVQQRLITAELNARNRAGH